MTKNPRHLVMPTILAAAIALTGAQLAAPHVTASATGTTPPPVILPTDGPGVPTDPKQPITNDWPW
jgi:hypothetical protein